jgi:hypothetical protein
MNTNQEKMDTAAGAVQERMETALAHQKQMKGSIQPFWSKLEEITRSWVETSWHLLVSRLRQSKPVTFFYGHLCPL